MQILTSLNQSGLFFVFLKNKIRMFYIQNSFFSTIIIYILCQVKVELLKYYFTKFTQKHILCLPERLGDLEMAAVVVLTFAKQNQKQVEKTKELTTSVPHLI